MLTPGTVLDTYLPTIILIGILFALNLLLKIKTYKSPIDFDTASHLYFAFLKKNKVPFLSSYKFGVKYLLPRLYTLLNNISDSPHKFRLFNVLSSLCVILIWVLSDTKITFNELPFYFWGVLLINSLWVNFSTSATEFHEVVLLMLIYSMSGLWSLKIVWPIQLSLLLILICGFKLTNILYLIPLLIFNYEMIFNNLWYSAIILLFVSIFITYSITPVLLSSKAYSKTRSWTHIKNVNFLKNNYAFSLMIFLIGLGNILFTTWEWAILQLTVWGVFVVSKQYLTYLYYPPIVLSLFIAFKNHWLNYVPFAAGMSLLATVFLFHTYRYIIKNNAREIDILFRTKFINYTDWDYYLKARDKQVEWLKQNIKEKTRVYLWGSDTSLLLLSGIVHMPNTFYNHNHLFYWSNLKDKKQHAIDYIFKNKPSYIIEAAVIDNINFPAERFKEEYSLVNCEDIMHVYQRKI